MSLIQEFESTTKLVSYVLGEYPETRGNDTWLYLKCCRELGAETLDDAQRLGLSIISVHKIRQKLQNKEGLFLPNEQVIETRKDREVEIRNYMKQ